MGDVNDEIRFGDRRDKNFAQTLLSVKPNLSFDHQPDNVSRNCARGLERVAIACTGRGRPVCLPGLGMRTTTGADT
jgi:hypothetical protein